MIRKITGTDWVFSDNPVLGKSRRDEAAGYLIERRFGTLPSDYDFVVVAGEVFESSFGENWKRREDLDYLLSLPQEGEDKVDSLLAHGWLPMPKEGETIAETVAELRRKLSLRNRQIRDLRRQLRK